MTADRVDVVVIGAGIAGLVAAVGTAEAGLRTVVLEQSADEEYICSSRLTGGVFHCALRAPDEDPGSLARTIIDGRGADGNAALAQSIAQDAMPAIRWLQRQGARFIRASPDPWQRFVLSPPSLGRTEEGWRRRGGDVLLRLLATRLAEQGGVLRRGHRACRLVLDADGAVTGVAGADFAIAARAVVIADGGFQQNAAMVAEQISPRPSLLVQRNGGTGHGDGRSMAVAAGAAIVADSRGFYGHVVSRDALVDDALRFYPWLDELARHGLAVTPDGRRFCDEGRGGIHLANRIAGLPDPASAVVIWDEAIWRGPGRARFMAPNPALDRHGATVYRAGTLQDVAKLAGIDFAGLSETVKAHNAAIGGVGDGSASPPRTAGAGAPMPIATPPFAAAPAAAGMTYTMGGIAVDGASRVQRASGEPFPNLFAVGGSSGGVEGGEKPMYVGGLVKASTTGWQAARSIAALLIDTSKCFNGPTIDQSVKV